MGKNKSRHMEKTEWATRRSALQKVDNELKKHPEQKQKGNIGHGKRKHDSADND